jgi:CheY-like chemotaxis protein
MNEKILVVDDDPILRKAIAYELSTLGYQVVEADSGSKAFDLICENRIDLVLTDVHMPNGGGLELLERTKARDSTTPVLLMSGFHDARGEKVLQKPFSRAQLIQIVEEALRPRSVKWKTPNSVIPNAREALA